MPSAATRTSQGHDEGFLGPLQGVAAAFGMELVAAEEQKLPPACSIN